MTQIFGLLVTLLKDNVCRGPLPGWGPRTLQPHLAVRSWVLSVPSGSDKPWLGDISPLSICGAVSASNTCQMSSYLRWRPRLGPSCGALSGDPHTFVCRKTGWVRCPAGVRTQAWAAACCTGLFPGRLLFGVVGTSPFSPQAEQPSPRSPPRGGEARRRGWARFLVCYGSRLTCHLGPGLSSPGPLFFPL